MNYLFVVIYTQVLVHVAACVCIRTCLFKATKKENVKIQLLPFQYFKNEIISFQSITINLV